MPEKWNITLRVSRRKQDQQPHFDDFSMEVNPDEYVLDAVERALERYKGPAPAFDDVTMMIARRY